MKKNTRVMSKKQYAYEFIRNCILEGTYRPGHRIIIDQVSKTLGLSIIPVREAIRQLEADGLILYRPYSGAIVSEINESDYLNLLSVLALLEGYAASESARVIPMETLYELDQLNEEMKEALHNLELNQFGILNYRFHEKIVSWSCNTLLIEKIQTVWDQLPRFRQYGFSFVPKRARDSIGEHAQIIQMLKNKVPPNETELYVREHYMATARAFQRKSELQKRSGW